MDVFRRWWPAWLALGGAVLGMVGVMWPQALGGASARPVPQVLRIGYAVEPPYAWVADDGQVRGQSPDLARWVAAELGVQRIDWVMTSFDRLVPDLLAHRFDMVAAGLFVTPERVRQVRFSDPVLRVAPALLMREDHPAAPQGLAGLLTLPALRVGVLAGSVEERWWRPRLVDGARLVLVPDVQAGAQAVHQGVVDVLALSEPTLRGWVRQHPGPWHLISPLPAAPQGPPVGWVAFQFAPDRGPLQQAWHRAQARVLAGPAYAELLRQLGLEGATPPAGLRLAEVLEATP